jgi:preprotein translocase subunit SecG
MVYLFLVLLILGCVILGFIILVQNPKGGGLQGNVGTFGNQMMGVKQTTDILEKGTWVFASFIAVLCMASTLFFGKPTKSSILDRNLGVPQQTQQNAAPQQPTAPAPAPTGK